MERNQATPPPIFCCWREMDNKPDGLATECLLQQLQLPSHLDPAEEAEHTMCHTHRSLLQQRGAGSQGFKGSSWVAAMIVFYHLQPETVALLCLLVGLAICNCSLQDSESDHPASPVGFSETVLISPACTALLSRLVGLHTSH